jgi:hypothetical protein
MQGHPGIPPEKSHAQLYFLFVGFVVCYYFSLDVQLLLKVGGRGWLCRLHCGVQLVLGRVTNIEYIQNKYCR